jgi:hypothetical protein
VVLPRSPDFSPVVFSFSETACPEAKQNRIAPAMPP